MNSKIRFNRPFITGKELHYIATAVALGNISGDGEFTQRCSRLLEERFGIHKVLITPSGTAALEMSAMLCDLRPDDEVILPSFTFVSMASAFVRLGAKPVFVDIDPDTLNIDADKIEAVITPRTKAIIPMHYAGVGCAMDRILAIAEAHDLRIVEDAAHGVNAFYRDRALGSIGHLGCYSFHETKNYVCGEGGALCINKPELVERAEIIRDKGTNRQQFFRGEVDKYTWVEIGSSYVASEIVCAFLYAQLEQMEALATIRRRLFDQYRAELQPLEDAGAVRLPRIPSECGSNHHCFFILLPDVETRDGLIKHLRQKSIEAVFHYVPLHSSPMGRRLGCDQVSLPVTEKVSQRLLRLPLYYALKEEDVTHVATTIRTFFPR